MSGPRLDDPHFTPTRWPLEVETRKNVWDDTSTVIRVTSVGHTGCVELLEDGSRPLSTLRAAMDSAFSAFDREPKWEPKADPRY